MRADNLRAHSAAMDVPQAPPTTKKADKNADVIGYV